MSSQQFHGQVEQVAAGDIKNFIEAPQVEQRLISSSQRQALNALVAEIAQEHEVEARMLWREVVHPSVGVESIGEIPRESFKTAEGALHSWRDHRREQANIKQMVARVLATTSDKGIEEARDSWCLRQFGERYLNSMSKDQLRQVLAFVEDYQVQPEVVVAAPLVGDRPAGLKFLPALKQLAVEHPIPSAILVFTLLVIGHAV